MKNFNLSEFILYAKNHNYIIMIFNHDSKIYNLNDLNLRLINDFQNLNIKSFRVSFQKENKDNEYINVRFIDNNILYIEYVCYINSDLEQCKYRLYSFYDSYNSNILSSIQKEILKENNIIFADKNFYTIEDLLKIKNNLIFI